MKLSIITINLNNAEGLRKTIESVVSQTFTDFEYIIIDGGSTDGSVDIIKQYERHITKWVSEKDSGIYNAMNKGIDLAIGGYTLFLNSGDYLYANDVLETLFSKSFTEDLIVCSIKIELVDKNDFIIHTIRTVGSAKRVINSFIFKQSLPHQSTLIKREIFNKFGKYDESYRCASDYDFFVKAIKNKSTIRIIPLILSVYNDQGISNTNKNLSLTEFFAIRKRYFLIKTIFFNKFVYKALIKIKRIIKKIANIKLIKQFIIIVYITMIYLFSNIIYKLLYRNKLLINNCNQEKLNIGFALYPHNNLYECDSTVNFLIKEIFDKQGYHTEFIQYDTNVVSKMNIFKKIFAKIIGIPFIYSELLNQKYSKYDILITDSRVNFHVNHPRCINLFHYSFEGYRKRVGINFGVKKHLKYIKNNIAQRLGSKNNINIAVSDFLKDVLKEDKININYVIYNSIDTEYFKPMNNIVEKKVFLYAGEYSFYGKGFDVLEKLAERSFKIDCITNYKKADKLNYLPVVSHDKITEVYNKYSILLYPSRFESCGKAPLEAMACGIPVIMSDVGIGCDLKKMIPEFVVNGYDANAIEQYIFNSKIILNNYSHYSAKAREFIVSNFSLQKFNKKWIELIENVTRSK